MKVKLITFTPNPEIVVAASARTSFKEYGTSVAYEKLKLSPEKVENEIRELLKHKHFSAIEHVSFTFSIEGVSRSLTHQLVRHRIASYTQQSQRYVKVDVNSDWFVIPKSYAGEKKEKFIQRMKQIAKWYEEDIANGIPCEDARFLLPNATKTNIVVTMNARELYHFFNLRCCERCQWELREVATEMLREVRKVAPILFEKAGPSCVTYDFCPEADLKPKTCDIKKIKERFKELK